MRPFIALLTLVSLGASVNVHADDGFGAFGGPASAKSFNVGKLELIALHDAQYIVHNDAKIFGADVTPAAVGEVLKASGAADDRITLSVNALLVRTGNRVVLLDSGLGPKASGELMASLSVAGVRASDITDVAITHTHGDHVGGLVDAGGKLAFPNATIRMAAAEWEWMKSQAASADLVKAIESQVQTFKPGAPIAPGVTSVALDGHTPGHVGYEVVSGTHRLLDIGDLAHSSIVSLKKPEWTMGFDSNSAVAKATRQSTLTRLAKDKELVFAPHFPFPGTGQVVADGTTFSWVPTAP